MLARALATLARALPPLAGVVAVTLLWVAPAAAHTSLLASTPPNGARLGAQPGAVELTFRDPVQARFAEVAVTGPGGTPVKVGPPRVLRATVLEVLPRLSRTGAYTVAWRVVSQDGHPVDGQLNFRLTGTAPATGPAAPAPPAGAPAQGSDSSLLVLHLIHAAGGLAILGFAGFVGYALRRARGAAR